MQDKGYIWINGELIDWDAAKIHALTHSLHYSGSVFEGEKSYNGKVFKLEEHTHRLIESATMLGLSIPYSFDDIIKAHHIVIEKNNIQDAYIRPLIWQGSESLNLTNKILSVNLLIAAIPSIPRPTNPLRLHLSRWRKPHPNSLPPQCKSAGHYNMMIVCQKEAKALGYDDAILLDWRGYIAECTTTNIFFVKDEQLFTPLPDAFLNGITRCTIIEIAKRLNIPLREEYIELERITHFDECFVTGTAMEVKAVNSFDFDDQKITFKNNKLTTLLKNEYNALVRR